MAHSFTSYRFKPTRKQGKGAGGLPGRAGEVGAPALGSRRMRGFKTKPGEKPLPGGEYAGERGERQRMPQKSVRLLIYLPVGGSFAFSAGEPAGHPAPGSVFPALSPIPLRGRARPSRSPAVYQAPLNTAGDLSPPRPGTCGAAAIPLAAGLRPACARLRKAPGSPSRVA